DPGSSGQSIGSADLHDPIEETKRSLGLNVLFEPNHVMVDLIFVHGLGGESRKTWSYSDPSVDCWLQAFLPSEKEFENCRIHSFGYDSNFISKDAHNTSDLADFGSALLSSLIYSPTLRGTPETPIVFVCHSMSGLVAKKAYILARRDPSCHNTAARCHAMVFLSTPHERITPLQADHHRMCKFSSPQDPNYVSVRNVLAAIVADEIRAIGEAPTNSPRDEFIQVNMLLGNLGEAPQNLEDFNEDTNAASGRWIT